MFIAVRGGGGWRAPPPVPGGPEALARRAASKARRAHASYKLAAKRADARARDKGHYPDRSGAAAVRTRVGGAAPPVPALPPMQQMQAHQQLAPHHQAAPRQQPAPAPGSDATLQCPACMTTLCFDCQQHVTGVC